VSAPPTAPRRRIRRIRICGFTSNSGIPLLCNVFRLILVLSGLTRVGRFRNQSGIRRIGRRFSVELACPHDAARTTRPYRVPTCGACLDRHAAPSTVACRPFPFTRVFPKYTWATTISAAPPDCVNQEQVRRKEPPAFAVSRRAAVIVGGSGGVSSRGCGRVHRCASRAAARPRPRRRLGRASHREDRFPPWVLMRSDAELAPCHRRPALRSVLRRCPTKSRGITFTKC
jgi:hypothetical protein